MWPYWAIVFKEIIKLKWDFCVCVVAPNPIWPISLYKGNIRTHKDTRGACAQRKCHVRTRLEDDHLWAKKRGAGEARLTSTLILDFQPPKLWEMNLLFKPSSLWYFVMAARANQLSPPDLILSSSHRLWWAQSLFFLGRLQSEGNHFSIKSFSLTLLQPKLLGTLWTFSLSPRLHPASPREGQGRSLDSPQSHSWPTDWKCHHWMRMVITAWWKEHRSWCQTAWAQIPDARWVTLRATYSKSSSLSVFPFLHI